MRLLIFLVLIPHWLFAQKSELNLKKTSGSEINLSFFIGSSFSQIKNKIEDQMVTSNLDDPTRGFFSNELIEHPHSSSYPALDVGLVYYINLRQGIKLNYGQSSDREFYGYENIGFWGNFIFLRSTIKMISINYIRAFMDKKHNIYAGISGIKHITEVDEKSIKKNKLGLNLGYTGKFVQKKWFYMAIKLVVRPATNIEIGPFSSSHQFENETYTSTFNETKFNLTTINLGLIIGFKHVTGRKKDE